MKIVISGYGYVGKATKLILSEKSDSIKVIEIQDPALDLHARSWEDAKYHFVCVPTPPTKVPYGHAKHDITAIRDAVTFAKLSGFSGTTVVRSTMSPVDCDTVSELVKDLIVWPEFLRQTHWQEDALSPPVSIMGGTRAMELKKEMPGFEPMISADARSACMVKIAINSYLAMRVIVANDLMKACDELGTNWALVNSCMKSDPRIGPSHWDQPGPDGMFGFGGACLPKDCDALAYLLSELEIRNNFADWAIKRNKEIRDE